MIPEVVGELRIIISKFWGCKDEDFRNRVRKFWGNEEEDIIFKFICICIR